MFSYSVIGKMYDVAPVFDDDGNVTNEPTFQDGWHVNAAGEVPTAWEQYEIDTPVTPMRVFQRQVTRFFVFPDKATFELILGDQNVGV